MSVKLTGRRLVSEAKNPSGNWMMIIQTTIAAGETSRVIRLTKISDRP